MSAVKVNNINSALMIMSLGLAYIIPFELFLFSYAILGPAHYLTEISWLHDRQYFSPRKRDYLWLVTLSLLIFVGSVYVLGDFAIPVIGKLSTEIIFTAFGLALIMVLTATFKWRIVGVLILLGSIVLFRSDHWPRLIFSIYLPTLIHVYIFTGAFILYGALKSHSQSGYLSFLVFLECTATCVVVDPGWVFTINNYVRQSYNPFSGLSVRLIQDFNLGEFSSYSDIFYSDAGKQAMRFIAFAYTYHYLNWFSKTSVIGWHQIPKSRYILICILWIASISLYIYDYNLGFRWLFLLSLAHVLLEFPLNHRSFIVIGTSIRHNISSRQTLQA